MGLAGFYVWKRSFPIVQTGYWGLRLGMSMEEVQQVKGKPDVVYEVGDDGFDHFIFKDDEAKKNRSDEEFNRWSYWPPKSVRFDIDFDEDKHGLMEVMCVSSEFVQHSRCPAIEGIKIGDSREQIIRTLGEPSRSEPSLNAEWLTYSSGVVFGLREKEKTVDMMGIRDLKYKLEEEK